MKSVMEAQDSRYPCSICGTDAEAGVNVLTMAGETFSKVAATFGVGRSAVYRHRKHFAERILLDREHAKKLMLKMQAEAESWNPPCDVGDYWRHVYHVEYPEPLDDGPHSIMPEGLGILAVAGIEPHRSWLLERLEHREPSRMA